MLLVSLLPFGHMELSMTLSAYATVVNGKELFSSDNEITDAWMGQKLRNLFLAYRDKALEPRQEKTSSSALDRGFEAEQKVKSYRITALEETSANEVTTEKLNAAILRTSTYQDKPGYKAENEQLLSELRTFYAFLQSRVLDPMKPISWWMLVRRATC